MSPTTIGLIVGIFAVGILAIVIVAVIVLLRGSRKDDVLGMGVESEAGDGGQAEEAAPPRSGMRGIPEGKPPAAEPPSPPAPAPPKAKTPSPEPSPAADETQAGARLKRDQEKTQVGKSTQVSRARKEAAKSAPSEEVDGDDEISSGEIKDSKEVAIGRGALGSASESTEDRRRREETAGSSPSAEVAGDVHGNVEVAGGDIIKTNGGNVYLFKNREQAMRYKKQSRRFDTAFPEKVELGKVATLWVGVATPDSPPPFEGVPAEAITSGPTAEVALPIDPASGEVQEVQIDVVVRAPQYKPSRDEATLTVYPDGKSDVTRFLLEAEDEGQGTVLVQFYLDKKRLGEVELKSVVEKARAGVTFGLKLQVATLYFAFGIG